MATVINTNMFSIYAQSQASLAQRAEQTAMERISSGMRINHAQDDAVGAALQEHLNAQLSSYSQSSRNINDGISLLQTADGSMGSITDALHRMRELTLQSVSGTLSGVDRGYLQDEFSSLQDEITGFVQGTEINGVSILNRPSGQLEKSIDVQLGGVFTDLVEHDSYQGFDFEVKTKGYYVGGTMMSTAGEETLIELPSSFWGNDLKIEVDGVSSATISFDPATKTAGEWATELQNKINADSNLAGAGKSVSVIYSKDDNNFAILSDSEGSASSVFVSQSTLDVFGVTAMDLGEAAQGELVSLYGVAPEDRTITVDVDNHAPVTVTFPEAIYSPGKWELYLKEQVDGLQVEYDSTNKSFTLSSVTGETGSVSLWGNAPALGLVVPDTQKVRVNHYDFDDPTHALGALLQNTQSIATEADASAMLAKIDSAVDYVNEGRAHFAAVENQLLKVSQKLEEYRVTSSKARSAIQDTDYAAESAAMAKNQILKQVTTAMMAQANQVPKQMLQLFK